VRNNRRNTVSTKTGKYIRRRLETASIAMDGVATAALSVIKKRPATKSQITTKIKPALYRLVMLSRLE
jgi:hypothetical protein